MPTHKKGHDKDKYYHLAKDQGFRSRAAFKLIQINKRFDFLSKARVCVDLCAAPGGWCQVAAKSMPAGSIVLGVDLLPIKAIRNVKTIVADITTSECRKMIVAELQGWKADVVLCDGAPNIGSAYSKDAYVQNELVIAALKVATDHLNAGGTFCTKVYRSVDYNAIVWVLQQFFEDVQTIKPNSSRSQSSEIFIVCLRYTAPAYIDPKFLDPNHVFKEVADPGLKKPDVFNKLREKSNLRQRSGYDESLGMTLRSFSTVTEFIESKDPIRFISDVHELRWDPESEQYKTHMKTKPEIIAAFEDLRVLGKVDFKKIIKWRQFIVDTIAAESQEANAGDGKLSKSQLHKEKRNAPVTEEVIQNEILTLHEIAAQAQRKDKKKSKRELAKERQRQNLGMTANAFDVGDDQELFNINEQTTLQQLHDLGDVDLAERDDAEESEVEDPEEAEREKRAIKAANEDLDAQLEGDYVRFLAGRRKKKTANDNDDDLEGRTVSSRKHKRDLKSAAKIGKLNEEDTLNGELETYVSLLSGGEKKTKRGPDGEEVVESDDNDSSDEDEEGNGSDSDSGPSKGRVVSRDGQNKAARVDKWFSHPIFKSGMINAGDKTVDFDDDKKKNKHEPRDRSEVALTDMPKTEKEKRKEARKKDTERKERKDNKRKLNNAADEETEAYNAEFKIVKQKGDDGEVYDKEGKTIAETPQTLEYRDMIKRGMGRAVVQEGGTKANNKRKSTAQEEEAAEDFQVVPAARELIDATLPVKDERSYDSDAENYDAHDRMTTLALATMMLRQSRKKAFVDASYNRFSWNDPKDLPSWFMDDEVRHNKPQLPIPAALLEQIKSRYQATGTREIKKVAEARMRKKKRAASKLKTAKKQASLMAENSEMSEKQKIKAISKAMRTTKIDKPGKVYVVTKKTSGASSGTSTGGKGKLKFVDKRMKKDARAMKKIAKNSKRKGKK